MNESTGSDNATSHDVKRQDSDPRSEILRRFFTGRTDAFAQWNRERAQWECIRREMPDYLLKSHLKGKITVATYPVNNLGNSSFVCYDLDLKTTDAYMLLEWLKEWFQSKGILFLPEDTGGRGLHGWGLFLCFVPASHAIALANLGLESYQKEIGTLPCPMEIFPKQAKPRDLGNCIRLPWGQHQMGDVSHFINGAGAVDDDAAVKAILSGKRTTQFDIEALLPHDAFTKVKRRKERLVTSDERWADVIAEGKRHNTLLSLAGELKAKRFSPEKLSTELQLHNRQRCRPPLDDGEVEAIAKGITETTAGAEKAESQADTLVRIASGHYLFHDLTGNAYAKYRNTNHSEIWPVHSRSYREWLAYHFYNQENKVPNTSAMSDALTTISGKARFAGPMHDLKVRVAWHSGSIWYDLADDRWRAVRIDRDGWQIVDEPPVLFRRYSHMLPQIEPARGGDASRIFDFLRLPDDNLDCLFITWLISCFVPDIPHPILIPYGPFGSGKTVQCRFIKSLVDPSAIPTLSFAGDRVQLVQQLAHHYCAMYDNIHHISTETSDLLCRAVTGEGFTKRQLYSDDDDVLYQFQRVIGINGLELMAERADLLDRAILLECEPIPDDKRLTETELWQKFNEAKTEILGGIFDTLWLALGILDGIKLHSLPRMADWMRWGCAIAEAQSYGKTTFLQGYAKAHRHQSLEALKANLVTEALMAYMESQDIFEGTVGQLLKALTQKAEQMNIETKAKGWPKLPNQLTKNLKGVRPNLEKEGIQITFTGHTRHGTNVVIKNIGQDTVTPSPQARPVNDDKVSVVTMPSSLPEPTVTQDSSVCDDVTVKTPTFLNEELLQLGKRLSYQRLQILPHLAIAEGVDSWQRFVKSTELEDLGNAIAVARGQIDIN